MANQKKLTDWFISHHSEIDLRATKLMWTEQWWPEITDFEVSIRVDGVSYVGRGINKDSDTAFIIGCVEAVERSLCKSNNIGSNGLALHFDEVKAKENALNELLERKYIKHFHDNKIQLPTFSDNYEFLNNIKQKLRAHNAELVIKNVELPKGQYLFYSSIFQINDSKPVGIFSGFGCGPEKLSSLEKSIAECLLNFAVLTENNNQLEDQLLKEKSENGLQPYNSSLTEVQELYSFLLDEPINNSFTVEALFEKIKFNKLALPEELYSGLELTAIQATFADINTKIINKVKSEVHHV